MASTGEVGVLCTYVLFVFRLVIAPAGADTVPEVDTELAETAPVDSDPALIAPVTVAESASILLVSRVPTSMILEPLWLISGCFAVPEGVPVESAANTKPQLIKKLP